MNANMMTPETMNEEPTTPGLQAQAGYADLDSAGAAAPTRPHRVSIHGSERVIGPS
ncbi:MAG: hypothetical protein U5O16_40215 [Rhodococcus sp. (in: high G+C Gram-positive bacteria)]|uniref:hypothetical protein n=1 Tax=Rhodococcus sp. TaxID=1831 RepID=UPI002ADA8BDE|nr:hypothetical protein [Rhodococcus sp. (in: high G+C Gram-positive bacteria)]